MSDAAADTAARMDAIEAALDQIKVLLQHRAASPAPTPADPAPVPGPRLFGTTTTTSKTVLRPNPPFVFDGDRTKGRAFLHAVRSYARLVPEAFEESGSPSEEKLVRYAMSFMATDAAQRWSERYTARVPFPFPTWNEFVTEFNLRFVQENEQDHALLRLESRAYHMGSRDVFRYTDDFEDLVDLAGFTDPIVKVTKFRTGLDQAINLAITGSSDPPALTDYSAWRLRAYRQYESQLRARNAQVSTRASVPVGRSTFPTGRPTAAPGRLPVPAAAVTPARAHAPAPPPPISMDVDRARARGAPRRGCFRCGDPNHFARDCPLPADARSIDVLDEVIQQLGGDLLDELLARLATTEAVAERAAAPEPEDFPLRDE